jgi:predicted DNA-binding transcriptional regulator
VERNKYGFQELLSRVLMTKEIFRDHILLKQLARATAMDMQERIYEAIMKRAEELEREFAKAQQEQG